MAGQHGPGVAAQSVPERRDVGRAFLHHVKMRIERRGLEHFRKRQLHLVGQRRQMRRRDLVIGVLDQVQMLDQEIALAQVDGRIKLSAPRSFADAPIGQSMIDFARERGWTINTPLENNQRGGSVMIGVENAQEMAERLATSPVLETERLLLRPPSGADFEAWAAFTADPEASRFLGGPAGRPTAWRNLCTMAGSWTVMGFGNFSVIEKATGRWVGRIGLNEILDWPGPDKVEVGWELHQEFWGRGLATEGGRASMRYGFEVVGLARIMSATMATNAASRRVMDKCGLRFQGELHLPGAVVAWYAVDRAHWRANQAGGSIGGSPGGW